MRMRERKQSERGGRIPLNEQKSVKERSVCKASAKRLRSWVMLYHSRRILSTVLVVDEVGFLLYLRDVVASGDENGNKLISLINPRALAPLTQTRQRRRCTGEYVVRRRIHHFHPTSTFQSLSSAKST